MSDDSKTGSANLSDEAREAFGPAPRPGSKTESAPAASNERPEPQRASDPRISGVPSERLVAGYDLEGETAYDVAPVGPTEMHAEADLVDSPATLRPSTKSASVEELEQQIRELESRLDAMIDTPAAQPKAASATPRAAKAEPAMADPAGEILASDYYAKKWGRDGLRSRTEEVDEFGLDPDYEKRFQPFIEFLFKTYFRVEVRGADGVPTSGRAVIVANHSGGPLPYDGLMLRAAIRREAAAAGAATMPDLRWLAEDFIYYLPFVGTAMNRLGAVRACQENAERLLAQKKLVAVFPEGAKGIGKLYKERYQLQRFGRGGFVRLCLRARAPLVPAAIVGAEEANPLLARVELLAKTFGLPYLPVTPTFPALGPLGLLPAPTKWKIEFGEPIDLKEYGPEAAEDELLVGRLTERVRSSIQGMLDRAIASRRSVWLG